MTTLPLLTAALLFAPAAADESPPNAVAVAGTGAAASAGDGGPAGAAAVHDPFGVAVGPDGGIFICEVGGHRVRRIDPATGNIATVVGTGEVGSSGDGGPATGARLNEPYEIAFDAAGRWLIVDMRAHAVRRVDPGTGRIETVAGTGEAGFSGDGGPATGAKLNRPHSVCVTPDGTLLICDIGNHRVRAVDPATGVIRTVAGTGDPGPTPDGAAFSPATPLAGPRALAVDPRTGDLLLALREGNAVFRIDAATSTLRRIAGTGRKGNSGDGGDARRARLAGPKGVAVAADGTVLIADTENHAVRAVDAGTGLIRTILGGPDAAGGATLSRPHGVAVTPAGGVLVGDSGGNRVWRLAGP